MVVALKSRVKVPLRCRTSVPPVSKEQEIKGAEDGHDTHDSNPNESASPRNPIEENHHRSDDMKEQNNPKQDGKSRGIELHRELSYHGLALASRFRSRWRAVATNESPKTLASPAPKRAATPQRRGPPVKSSATASMFQMMLANA